MSRATNWILGGIFLVVLAICVVGAVLALSAGNEDIEVNLGDDEFEVPDVEGAAERIAEGGPDLYPDLVGGNRPILLNHVGDDATEGWVAVVAIAPGTEGCLVVWDADDEVFRDCEGTAYPPDGEGLETFPTWVEDDTLFVDLGRGPSDDPPADTVPDDTIVVTGD